MPGEVDDAFLASAEKKDTATRKTDAARMRDEHRKSEKRHRVFDWSKFSGESVFFHHKVDRVRISFAEKCGLVITDDRHQATLIVVPDLKEAGERNTWSAMLRGAYLASADALQDTPAGGVVKLKAAFASRRSVYLSDSFRRKHEEIAQLFSICKGPKGRQWPKLADEATFQDKHAKSLRKKRGFANIGLGTSSDQKDYDDDGEDAGAQKMIGIMVTMMLTMVVLVVAGVTTVVVPIPE